LPHDSKDLFPADTCVCEQTSVLLFPQFTGIKHTPTVQLATDCSLTALYSTLLWKVTVPVIAALQD